MKPLQRGLDSLQSATLWLAQHGISNPNDAGAGAVDYLRLMGIVVTGWMWARMAKFAKEKLAPTPPNAQFYKEKLVSARYWMERMMPECPMLPSASRPAARRSWPLKQRNSRSLITFPEVG